MATDKKGIAILLGGPPPKGGASDDDSKGPSDEELRVAADDVFDAIQKGDRDSFASALHSYCRLCDMDDDKGNGY